MSAGAVLELRSQERVVERVKDRPELAVLSSLLGHPRGEVSGLALRGEPGVGKSALLDAVAAEAPGRGLRVLRACGAEAEVELPFSGLHQLLYPLTEYTGRLPRTQQEALNRAFGLAEGPQPARFVISAAALALVNVAAAAEGPLLLLVDDVAGIDRNSAEVIGFIARRLAGEPVLFLAAVTEADPVTLTAGLPELRVRPRPEAAPAWHQVPEPGRVQSWVDRGADLTDQELRIAGLAARGLTNKQIGEELFLSHRTVGTHLYKIFPKLGITSRAALRDALQALPQ